MSEPIQDRGRGPEISGTRITVYNLLQSFLDPTITETDICRIYNLTDWQVAAARAYIFNNPDTVLAEHLKIEERFQAGNSLQVKEFAERAKSTFMKYKEWLDHQNENQIITTQEKPVQFPSFREWLADQESR